MKFIMYDGKCDNVCVITIVQNNEIYIMKYA
jgi:hypothetical protein